MWRFSMSRVVAFSGYKGSGKDTAADYLVGEYGYTKLSLASALKDIVAQNYDIPRDWLDDRQLKEQGLIKYPVIATDPFSELLHKQLESELRCGFWTPRALCILEGSAKRAVHSNYWTSRIVSQMHPDRKYVISDLRYRSEADTLRMLLPKQELQLIRINRFPTVDTNDPSERDLDQYNFDNSIGREIQNIPDLHQALRFLAMSAGIERQSI
jgi:adenylate kinase family enzyme